MSGPLIDFPAIRFAPLSRSGGGQLRPVSPIFGTQLDAARKKEVLGGVTWLCGQSMHHRRYSVNMVLVRIAASLSAKQFIYYETAEGRPMAFVNWAFLSDEAFKRIVEEGGPLRSNDWHTGQNAFVPELIAPFGNIRRVVRDLKSHVFDKGVRVCALRSRDAYDSSGAFKESATPTVHRFRA